MSWGQGSLQEVAARGRAYNLQLASAPAKAAAAAQRDIASMQAATARGQTQMQGGMFLMKLDAWNRMLQQQQKQAGGLSGMINEYNQAFQEAKTANEAKYQEALGVVGTTSGQQRADVFKQYGMQESSAMQNLARLGMSGTTIAPTLRSGIQRERQSALNRVSDAEMQARLGVMGGFEHKYPESGVTQAAIQATASGWQFPSF